ncbi:MAG: chemotaxis-specific protein-glutamate methyltransferase CheB [Aquificaceae bacterium]|nr:chemotaxis-specific protein-glutamate methyltransferase CheB [Aquificaceae bacterium]
MINVLIVDDSKFVRMAIRKMLEEHGGFNVVGEARDGEEAVRLARMLNPDVITMDIVMPNMDGISAIREIAKFSQAPIVVISDHTVEGAKVTMEALSAGAVDFIPKGSEGLKFNITKVGRELVEKIELYATRREKKPDRKVFTAKNFPQEHHPVVRKPKVDKVDMVGVAASTGGPKVMPALLKSMGRLPVPVVIAQHMPKTFTASFAEWLSKETQLSVEEGYDEMELKKDLVVVLPGSVNSYVTKSGGSFYLKVDPSSQTIVKPSANILFKSMVKEANNPIALILTGMGDDGTEGAKEFVEKGYTVIAQEPSTCVVCGMPCSAIQAGACTYIMNVEEMGNKVRELCGVDT